MEKRCLQLLLWKSHCIVLAKKSSYIVQKTQINFVGKPIYTCKSRKSRYTRLTGKFDLGIQNEAGQRLTEFCQENTLAIANTLCQQHKRQLYDVDITRWSIPEQIDYFFCSWKWRSSIQSAKNKTRSWLCLRSQTPYAKFRLKLKKVGKTTKPFKYDLN